MEILMCDRWEYKGYRYTSFDDESFATIMKFISASNCRVVVVQKTSKSY